MLCMFMHDAYFMSVYIYIYMSVFINVYVYCMGVECIPCICVVYVCCECCLCVLCTPCLMSLKLAGVHQWRVMACDKHVYGLTSSWPISM